MCISLKHAIEELPEILHFQIFGWGLLPNLAGAIANSVEDFWRELGQIIAPNRPRMIPFREPPFMRNLFLF
jgi:hypothetical protein